VPAVGARVDASVVGGVVVLFVSHVVLERVMFSSIMNRAAAVRLRDSMSRTMSNPPRAGVASGGVKFGMYTYLYGDRVGEGGRLVVDDCEWNVMPSYVGVDADGGRISDARMVLTLVDASLPGAWPVMIHVDDGHARAIVGAFDAALGK
jgi:hypothetical protein